MDELVKRLRNRRICIQQSGGLEDFPLLCEAADAIEELSNIVHEYQKFDGFLAAHGMFEQGPMIPIEPPKGG